MKQILIACLLGIGALLPTTEVKSSVISYYKKVDIHVLGGVLFATSQAGDGAISKLEVRDAATNALLLMENSCGGYSCSLDISDLSSGTYVAKVYCANTTHTEAFNY